MSVTEKLTSAATGKTLLPYPIHEYAFISPEHLTFTAAVRSACEANLCGRYGKSWVCPPGAGDWQNLRDHYQSYSHAFVYTTRHDLEDSFDIEGMDEGKKLHEADDKELLRLLSDEQTPHELSGAGSCSLCEQCTYPNAPCRHPELARRSMEACGIDVVTLAKDTSIHYMNGVNTVTYFSIIYY